MHCRVFTASLACLPLDASSTLYGLQQGKMPHTLPNAPLVESTGLRCFRFQGPFSGTALLEFKALPEGKKARPETPGGLSKVAGLGRYGCV